MYIYLSTRCGGRREREVKSVVICGRGREGSQACPKERKLCGPQFRSFSSSYPILSLSLSTSFVRVRTSHWFQAECVLRRDRSPFARAWVCKCACAYNVRVARPWKRHTPLPLLGHLPSPSQPPRGMRGRLVWEIECVQWVCFPTIRRRTCGRKFFKFFGKRRLKGFDDWSLLM